MSSERVMIFIDGSNFYHSLKRSFGKASVDISNFCDSLKEDGNLIRIMYYTSPVNQKDAPQQYKDQQRFLEKLKQTKRLTLFLGRLEKRPNNNRVEKGVDVKLAVDLLANAFNDKYDIGIVVSNDADFVPAIEEVQNLGKKVYNVNFPKGRSFHLNNVCDKTINVDSIKKFLV